MSSSSGFATPRPAAVSIRTVNFDIIFIQRSIRVVKRYTVDDTVKHERSLFVFGDNDARRGLGGQATIRGSPNAIGIPTKKHPNTRAKDYYSDVEFVQNRVKILRAIREMIGTFVMGDYNTLVVPEDGLGTGLAKLPLTAPLTYKFLCLAFECIARMLPKIMPSMIENYYALMTQESAADLIAEGRGQVSEVMVVRDANGKSTTIDLNASTKENRQRALQHDREVLAIIKANVIEKVMTAVEAEAARTSIDAKTSRLTETSWLALVSSPSPHTSPTLGRLKRVHSDGPQSPRDLLGMNKSAK